MSCVTKPFVSPEWPAVRSGEVDDAELPRSETLDPAIRVSMILSGAVPFCSSVVDEHLIGVRAVDARLARGDAFARDDNRLYAHQKRVVAVDARRGRDDDAARARSTAITDHVARAVDGRTTNAVSVATKAKRRGRMTINARRRVVD